MIEFPCGCKFEKNDKGLPVFNPNIEDMPLDCTRTWDMICEGNTKGVFQLESQLGQSKAKEVRPRSIEELSDLIAIIRPGCGDAIVDGKSLTQHYIDRKSKKDPVEYFHNDLEPVLKSTYGILVYQEQAMQIAQLVAGFSLQQADNLRKAIGKKKVDLMAQVKKEFFAGAKEAGKFTEEEVEEIFSWIEKSQKYSFNKSHSISYAYNGYQTAYAKAHFPRAFFTSYLRHADGKPKPFIEISELVNNARIMDIDIIPPSIKNLSPKFKLIDNKPTFGIVNVKNVGQSVYDQLHGYITTNNINVDEMGWEEFLMRLGRFIKSNSFESMIKAGVFDCYGLHRSKMLYDFSIYKEIKDRDKKFLSEDKSKVFKEGLERLIDDIKIRRRTAWTDKNIDFIKSSIISIESPPYELIDKWSWRAKQERDLLGIELTCSEIDEYDTIDANCTCREYIKGFDFKTIAIAAQVTDIREWKIKKAGANKGNVMAFLKISDNTCCLDSVTVFSEDWKTMKDKVSIGKVLLFRGDRDKKKGSFLLKSVQKLNQCI